MIELAQHIEVLLLENDCVIVPGLGGFVAHYTPAMRVAEENVFLPPLPNSTIKIFVKNCTCIKGMENTKECSFMENYSVHQEVVQR